MAKSRNPNRDKAFDLYKQHYGKITSKEIAVLLNEKVKNIEYWRIMDSWKQKYNPKGGAPKGNKNAVGNDGGAPQGNQNARTYGWYSKYFPTETRNLIKEAEEAGGSPLEILWAQIMTQWIAIIRAQEIMFVTDKNEMIKELKKRKEIDGDKMSGLEEEWEFQFAWDRQATFLNAQSRAMSQLTSMIKRYDEMLHANWEMATEEQKLRVEKLKVQIKDPGLQHKKKVDANKHRLARERFKHQKDIDSKKYW